MSSPRSTRIHQDLSMGGAAAGGPSILGQVQKVYGGGGGVYPFATTSIEPGAKINSFVITIK